MRRAIPIALSLLLAACASTPAVPDGVPIRVTWTDVRRGQSFGLVNESHTSRAELYSQVRHDASVKVITDEIMAELVKTLRREGLDEFGQGGRAPSRGYSRAIEVDVSGERSFLGAGAGSPGGELEAMRSCEQSFFAVYNLETAYQSVTNDEGILFFDDQKTRK